MCSFPLFLVGAVEDFTGIPDVGLEVSKLQMIDVGDCRGKWIAAYMIQYGSSADLMAFCKASCFSIPFFIGVPPQMD